MIKKVLDFLKKIIQNGTKESSKRLIAIWSMLLVTIVVITAISLSNDYISILIALLSFISGVLGLSTYQNIKQKKEE